MRIVRAILQQNTDRQAVIVNLVRDARQAYGDSPAAAMKDEAVWRRLVQRVARVVREMPLWRLQLIGKEEFMFLYDHQGDGRTIRLRPGVAYCLRKFHALIADLVRGAWVRYVRQQYLNVLAETADLNEFLFGSERNNLVQVRPVLLDLQHGRCFYCKGNISAGSAHVDHFVPSTREIKSDPDARMAIRKALGQILEYALFDAAPRRKVPDLYIMSPGPCTPDITKYVERLRKQFGVPLQYRCYRRGDTVLPL